MLPTIDLPVYDLKIPSNGEYIKIRPFTVKEEKLLLMAAESDDSNEIINTTKQVIDSCIVSEKINLDKLPFFDIDYIFIALRAKSIGESVDIKFTCNNVVNEQLCKNVFPAKIDISNCKIVKNESISKDINLGKGINIKMKYPGYSIVKSLVNTERDIDRQVHFIANSIEMIQDKDKIYTSKDMTPDEIVSFVENLTREQYDKLVEFIDNYPSFVITAEADCTKCGFHHHIEYRDFTSFFV